MIETEKSVPSQNPSKSVMQTKEGYKMTEVGVIPEDWDLIPFDTIFSFHSTSNYSKAEMSDEGDVGCIHYGLIHAIPNSQYNLEDGIKYYVSTEQAKYEFVRDGDVIMVDASEDLEGINKSVEVFGVGIKKFISGLHTYLLRDKNNSLAKNFRGIVLNSQVVKNQMLQLAVGMKVFGVSKTQLIKVKIPLPPTLQEQKAIATALSDVDALISSLDKLIEKKKAIKQGAMQELLTGKTRLVNGQNHRLDRLKEDTDYHRTKRKSVQSQNPSKSVMQTKEGYKMTEVGRIPEDWCLEPIESFTKITTGAKDTQDRDDEGKYPFFVRSQKVERIRSYSFEGEAVLTSGDGVGVGKIYHYIIGKFDFHQRVYCMYDFREDVFGKYFFYQFSIKFHDRVMSMTAKSSVDSVRREMIADMRIPLPPTLQEQKAIATALSDMDSEIGELETKRDKYKQIKQGMMQELLTGKTRLI